MSASTVGQRSTIVQQNVQTEMVVAPCCRLCATSLLIRNRPWFISAGADTANLTGPSAAHRHTCGWQHTLEALKAPAADGERGEEAAVEEHSNGNRNLAQRLIASLRGR